MPRVVPPIVLALAKHPLVDEFDLSSLEFVDSGAAPLSAELEVACAKRLGCRIQQGYGLTETSPTTHWVTDDLAGQMPGEIGPAAAQHRVPDRRPRDRRGRRRRRAGRAAHPRPAGDEGLPQQPRGDRAGDRPDGWLHTGDVARIEEDGSLRIVDRIKELIKYKGYQIAPAELEALLLTHPAITDAAVIPIPDEEAGEVPKAFVVAERSRSRPRR